MEIVSGQINRTQEAIDAALPLMRKGDLKRIAMITKKASSIRHCNADTFPLGEYDDIVDAVDTVTAKIARVMKAQESDVPIISSMGAGNKLDGSQFRIADIIRQKCVPWQKSCGGN